MHRAYQLILPCGNKYLQLKWDKAKYEEHKKRIQAAKPLVDTSAPATYSHLHLKLGKLKLEEDRLSAIETDNHLLLEKMSCIMRTKGQIDNKNDYKATRREKRKQELRRVNRETRAILDRITKSQPQYQVQQWHEDWQRAEKYMANVARYPRGRCKSQSQKHYPSARSLVPVLIPEDLLRRGKAFKRKSNKNSGIVKKKQNPSPASVRRPFLNTAISFLIKISKTITIQSEAESKYRKLQPKQEGEFKKKTSKQARKREKQLKEEGVKSEEGKRKRTCPPLKGNEQLEQDRVPEIALFQ